jgi:hypothetical protein
MSKEPERGKTERGDDVFQVSDIVFDLIGRRCDPGTVSMSAQVER